jgi:hypothetical protein
MDRKLRSLQTNVGVPGEGGQKHVHVNCCSVVFSNRAQRVWFSGDWTLAKTSFRVVSPAKPPPIPHPYVAGGKTLFCYKKKKKKKTSVGETSRENDGSGAHEGDYKRAARNNPRARGNCVRSVTVARINRTPYVMRPVQLPSISLPVRGRDSTAPGGELERAKLSVTLRKPYRLVRTRTMSGTD